MVGSKLRMLFGMGTVCGVAAMLVLVAGCPFAPGPPACTENADCDDGLFCNGEETCVDGACVDGTAPCVEGETCDEENDLCYVACETEADCDDADLCTTDECVDGACVNTPMVCDDEDPCTTDECADGECVYTPIVCDDEDLCTTDECVDGECVYTPVVCDDEDLCTTDECDPETGECVFTPVECPEGEVCDAATGECIAACETDEDCADDGLFCTGDPVCTDGVCGFTGDPCVDDGLLCDEEAGACVECLTDDDCDVAAGETCADGVCVGGACEDDTDCDDGLFCNGIETCDLTDPENGVCVDGDRPCNDTDATGAVITCDEGAVEYCEEGDTEAVCTACPSETLDFTLGSDDLTGTVGDDTFKAELEFSPGAGRQISQLQTGDSANGLAGTDTLNAKVNGTGAAAGTSTPTLSGIEILNFSVFDYDQTINATNITGAETINSVNSTNQLILTPLQNNVGLGLTNSSAAAATDIIHATFVSGVTSGPGETCTLTLGGNITGGDVTVVTGGSSGFETVAFVSSGADPNTLSEFVSGDASLVTATFDGSQNLNMQLIPDEIVTIDAATMSGNLTLGDGETADPGGTDPYVTFATGGAVDYKNITGGLGDDLFIFAGSLTTADFDGSGEALDGGAAGFDIVQASIGASIGIAISMPNIDEIRTNATGNALTWKLDAPQIETITIDQDAAKNTVFEIKGITGTPDLNFRGDGEAAGADIPFDGIKYTSNSVTGSGDTLNINIGNRVTAVNTTTATSWVMDLEALSIMKFENINLTVANGHATINGIDATASAAEQTWTIVTSHNLTLGTVDSDAKEQNSVDATGVVGDFSATFSDLNDNATVTLGGGDDIFSAAGSTGDGISIDAGAGDDMITGSAQGDDIDAGADDDVIISGNGTDTLTGGSGKDMFAFNTIVLAANANTIADFEAGANKDKLRFDATTFTDYSAGATVTFDAGGAACAALTVAVDNVIIRNTAANILLTTPAAGAQAVIAVATDTGAIYYDANGNFTAGAVIIGNMTAAQVANLVAGNFVIVP